LAAVGLATVLMAPQVASAADTYAGRGMPKIALNDPSEAVAINDRLSDQLEGMRVFNDALHRSINSYASQNISGMQKARNLAVAFDFSIRQASHDDLAYTDRVLIAPMAGEDPQQINELIGSINEKKRDLVEFAATLTEIEKAYANGDETGVQYWSGRFAYLAGETEDKLYEDITPAGLDRSVDPSTTVRP
jgi:hypothetical protein